ncbi:MAG: ACT domain-containing protein [Sporomusaceae bacterium]|nr:ACT domain-containing protein [Sporomusaceae bacterium]
MKIRAVNIIDETLPEVACRSGISRIELRADETLSVQQIQGIFQLIAAQQIPLQCISLRPDHLAFTAPAAAIEKLSLLFAPSGYRLAISGCCAEITVAGGQFEHMPDVAAKIIAALKAAEVYILDLNSSHASASVLIDQSDLARANQAIYAALPALRP